MILARIKKVMKAIALVLAWIVCTIFYFVVLGPYSLLGKLALGRDPMEQRLDPKQRSYWRRLDYRRRHPERPF